MSADIIDGKAFAEGLRARVAEAVPAFVEATGRKPGLAVVLVGEDPASQIYVRSKGKATEAAGMESFEHRLPDTTTQDELIALVERLNADEAVDGILVQLPLPRGIDDKAVIAAIDPAKPMAQLLLAENCTVTVAHSRTRDLPGVVRRADIVVAAVGRPQMIRGDWLKPGATVIDVGINRIQIGEGKTRLVGDIEFESASEVAGAITPVPGGVGPMTIAVLLRNTLVAAHARAGLPAPQDL